MRTSAPSCFEQCVHLDEFIDPAAMVAATDASGRMASMTLVDVSDRRGQTQSESILAGINRFLMAPVAIDAGVVMEGA